MYPCATRGLPHIFVWGSCLLLCTPHPPPALRPTNFVTHNSLTHTQLSHPQLRHTHTLAQKQLIELLMWNAAVVQKHQQTKKNTMR